MLVTFLSSIFSWLDTTTVLVLSLVAYLSWKLYEGHDLPPGPWGIPVVGYLPFLRECNPEEKFTQLSKKYGKIMSVFLGNELLVILNSHDAIKEAFEKQGNIFAGRPQGRFFKIRETDRGVSHLDGEPWAEHRRFIHSTLKEYCTAKSSMEPRIAEEVQSFLDVLAEQNGQPFDIADLLTLSAANIVCTLQFGRRFDYQDEKFIILLKLREKILNVFARIPSRTFLPWLKYLPHTESFTRREEVSKAQDILEDYVMDLVQEHMASYEENSRKNLIDAYFTERNTLVTKTGDEGHFGVQELKGTLVALHGTGTVTITSTLRWAFLCMLLHPEIQKKVQEEIETVVGMERRPSMIDMVKMPYTQAVLMETHRFGTIMPLGLPHSNLEATELYGYRIPKRTSIIPNILAVHHDPNIWENPEIFMPERFLNKDGNVVKSEYLIPFGIGKRACLGEALADMELFVYFTFCLQRFELQPQPGISLMLDMETTYARRPKPFKLQAFQREGYCIT